MELGVPHNVRFHADDAGRMGLTNDGTTADGVAHEASSNMNMATNPETRTFRGAAKWFVASPRCGESWVRTPPASKTGPSFII